MTAANLHQTPESAHPQTALAGAGTTYLLAGATATGKSAVAQILAERLGGAILSADSMLVYRGMDIGTAKPSRAERGQVPYFGLDLVTPEMPFNTGLWLREARRAQLSGAGRPLIITGGTGLYFKALLQGLAGSASAPAIRDKYHQLHKEQGLQGLRSALAARLGCADHPLLNSDNPRRLTRALEQLERDGTLPDNWLSESDTTPGRSQTPLPVLRLPRAQLHRRIRARAEAMLAGGLIDEVRQLQRAYPEWSQTAAKAIGYSETLALIKGELTPGEALEKIVIRTRQLAKRQETWFAHQAVPCWIDITQDDTPAAIAARVEEVWYEHGATARP